MLARKAKVSAVLGFSFGGPYDGGRCNEFWSGDVILGFLFRVRRPVG